MTKKLIHSSYLQYLKTLSVKLKEDPKQFWSFHSIKSKRRIPETVRYNGMPSTDPARERWNCSINFFVQCILFFPSREIIPL